MEFSSPARRQREKGRDQYLVSKDRADIDPKLSFRKTPSACDCAVHVNEVRQQPQGALMIGYPLTRHRHGASSALDWF